MNRRLKLAMCSTLALAVLSACAQHGHAGDATGEADAAAGKTHRSLWEAMHGGASPSAKAPPQKAASGGATKSLQDDASWRTDPHIKEFYALSAAMLAPGKTVDRALYEAKAHDIFQAFALSRGMDPAAMQDHLKAIPGQMIQIAHEDPNVLKSQDAFITALFGPE